MAGKKLEPKGFTMQDTLKFNRVTTDIGGNLETLKQQLGELNRGAFPRCRGTRPVRTICAVSCSGRGLTISPPLARHQRLSLTRLDAKIFLRSCTNW